MNCMVVQERRADGGGRKRHADEKRRGGFDRCGGRVKIDIRHSS